MGEREESKVALRFLAQVLALNKMRSTERGGLLGGVVRLLWDVSVTCVGAV